jgi:hypothetical protein
MGWRKVDVEAEVVSGGNCRCRNLDCSALLRGHGGDDDVIRCPVQFGERQSVLLLQAEAFQRQSEHHAVFHQRPPELGRIRSHHWSVGRQTDIHGDLVKHHVLRWHAQRSARGIQRDGAARKHRRQDFRRAAQDRGCWHLLLLPAHRDGTQRRQSAVLHRQ